MNFRSLSTDDQKCPDHVFNAIKKYLLQGIQPGSFTSCVLYNDFAGAVVRADPESYRNLHGIAIFMSNYVYSYAWGSPSEVIKWKQNLKNEDWLRENQDLLKRIEVELEEYQERIVKPIKEYGTIE